MYNLNKYINKKKEHWLKYQIKKLEKNCKKWGEVEKRMHLVKRRMKFKDQMYKMVTIYIYKSLIC